MCILGFQIRFLTAVASVQCQKSLSEMLYPSEGCPRNPNKAPPFDRYGNNPISMSQCMVFARFGQLGCTFTKNDGCVVATHDLCRLECVSSVFVVLYLGNLLARQMHRMCVKQPGAIATRSCMAM
jgi:hypothetical protein